jgi:phosphoglycerate dehydrogenase-like enzyme
MRPRILIPVRSIYREDLLPEQVISTLEEFAEIEIAIDPAELSRDEYARLFANKDAVLSTWNTPLIDKQVLEQANELKIISHVGGEVRPFISPELFSLKPDLVLCNASNVMAKPVAEHILCVILACLRNLFHFRQWVKEDENWWEYDKSKNVSLLEKKVGIVGLGQIAREFIGLVRPFDVELWVFSRHLTDQQAAEDGLRKSSLEEIFSSCEVITITAASVSGNRHMIDAGLLAMIKPHAVLVNNARGMLIDEAALIRELETGRFTAAIDVTDPEPPAADSRLRQLDNVLLTPHIGGPTPGQRIWMVNEAVDNLMAFFQQRPVRGIIDKKRFSYMA